LRVKISLKKLHISWSSAYRVA